MADRQTLTDLAAELLAWEGVSPRRMFGTDVFMVDGKMFVFVSQDGLVVKMSETLREEALALSGAEPYRHGGGMPFGNWVQFKGVPPSETIEWARRGYAFVKSAPAPKRRSRARRGTLR
ncbi:MAG: TfoX/Sxy family protein [Dehalococcoidia bacterium]